MGTYAALATIDAVYFAGSIASIVSLFLMLRKWRNK